MTIASTTGANPGLTGTVLGLAPVTFMVVLIVGLLVLATVILLAIRSRLPQSARRELLSRVRSWWVMVVLFVLAITIDWRVTLVSLAFLSFLALKEFYTLVHLRLADRRAILLSYLSIPVQYWWVYVAWYGMFIIFVPVYLFLIMAFRLVLAGETNRFMTSVAKLHWGLMAFVFGISHLGYLLVLPELEGFEAGPRGLIFYVVFLAEFNDVLQYMFGKAFGKRKLAPSISPGKTWAGFLGGLVCTSLLGVGVMFLTPFLWWQALIAGFLIASLGPVGDLVMSAIKRDVGVKDSGSLIPGHGGILDRIDSLCFSVPIFFHYVTWLYYPMVK